MKKLFSLLCLGMLALAGYAQDRIDTIACQYIVDGHFFKTLSEEDREELNNIPVFILRASGQRVIGYLVSSKYHISSRLLANEVPLKYVQNGDALLTQYQDKLLWTNLITEKAKEGLMLREGMTLDPFSLKDFDGTVWDNDRIGGKVTVVNVWYSGCGPCLAEMPIISGWKDQFPDVNFLSVDYESKEKMQSITERRGFTWTHLYGDRYFTSWVTTQTEETGFPLTIVIDADGYVRHVVHGTNDEKRAAVVEAIKMCLK